MLRARLIEADKQASTAIDRISAKTLARRMHHHTPRYEYPAAIARKWRTALPAYERLDLRTQLEKRALAIDELRIGGNRFRFASWAADAHEPGVSVLCVSLTIAPHGTFKCNITTLAAASLHCLASRLQR